MTINTKKPETPEEKAHELMRRELWMKTAVAATRECGNNAFAMTKIKSLADDVLSAFDNRFEEPV